MCDSEWTLQFDSLLAKYSPRVLAEFAADIHSDDFWLIGPAGAGRQFVILNPGISPIYGQNPGCRVVSYRRGDRPHDVLPDEPDVREQHNKGDVETGIYLYPSVEGADLRMTPRSFRVAWW
jgi:hypothetical protein